jgi:hypothetical protein
MAPAIPRLAWTTRVGKTLGIRWRATTPKGETPAACAASTNAGDESDRQQDPREGHEHIGHAHQQRIDTPPGVARDGADDGADEAGESHDGHPDTH